MARPERQELSRSRSVRVLFPLVVGAAVAVAIGFRPPVVSGKSIGEMAGRALADDRESEGCGVCADYRCPSDPEVDCLLGAAADTCGCCRAGVCARLSGEQCWNASIETLPRESRSYGACARNYVCVLRTDLQESDPPEAICDCEHSSPVCGTNGRSYSTICALQEASIRVKRHQRHQTLELAHEGPCAELPIIYSSSDDVTLPSGYRVILNCEAKGYPIPEIFWEFRSAGDDRVLILPSGEHEADIASTEDPDNFLRSSWMQLARLEKPDVGTYQCIASNSVGQASASAVVRISEYEIDGKRNGEFEIKWKRQNNARSGSW